jgi:hypothetical protein
MDRVDALQFGAGRKLSDFLGKDCVALSHIEVAAGIACA